MKGILTETGTRLKLTGIDKSEYYANGVLKNCSLGEENTIPTRYGNLIPKYGPEELRKKYTPSVSFYGSGAVKSIALEKQTDITTPIGSFPAELVTFYESGAIKRLFPLNGKISGYWSEADEEQLCREFKFWFPFGSFKTKIISLYFYESGNLKAMTLWPGESIYLKKQVDIFPARIGFSLYEDGSLKSLEPAYELLIATPIGNISVYDESAIGISGELNSLCFKKDSSLRSLVTSSSKVMVSAQDGSSETFEPILRPDPFEEDKFILIPLKITFDGEHVIFEGEKKKVYEMSQFSFSVLNDVTPKNSSSFSCGDCSSCSLCK